MRKFEVFAGKSTFNLASSIVSCCAPSGEQRRSPLCEPVVSDTLVLLTDSVGETADMAGLAACSTTDPAADVETPAANHKITRSPNRQIAFC